MLTHHFCYTQPYSDMACTADLLPSVSQFVEGISGDDMATYELHGRVAL